MTGNARRQLEVAIERLAEPICLCDPDGRIVIANAAWRAVNAGVIEHAQPGMEFERHLRAGLKIGNYPDAVGCEPQWLAERMARHRIGGPAVEQRRQGGTWLLMRDEKLPDGSTLTFSLDITERKLAEEKLRQSEDRFHTLADLSADWYWEQDENFRFTGFTRDVEAAAGSSVGSHIGKTRWELPAVGVTQEKWAAHRAALESHLPFRDFEYQRVNEQGETIWMAASGVPVFDAEGRFKGYRGIGRNITQRRLAEQQLRALLDGIPDRAWLMDAQGRFVAINRSMEEAIGVPAAQAVGRKVTDFAPPEKARGIEEENALAMAASGPLRLEREATSGGSWREIIKAPIRTAEGEVVGMVGISRDVTERRIGQQALESARERLQRALEGSNLVLWDTDLRTREVYLSENWAELLGNPRGATRTTVDELMRLVHPADLPEIVRLSMETVKGTRTAYSVEHRVRTQDGGWKWIRSSGKVNERDAAGRALRMTGTNLDITARKLAEITLRESEARFRSLTKLSSDWYWEQDEHFRFTFIAGMHLEKTGVPETVRLGQTRWDMPAVNLNEADWGRHRAMLERHQPFVDFVMRRPDEAGGRPSWVSVSGEPVFDEHGAFRGYRGTGRDITEAQLAKERIQGLNAELEERVKSRTAELEALVTELQTFQYAVAHDLHTSLGVMSVNSGMLLNDLRSSLNEGHRRALARISEKAQLTARLLDDLLAYSRLGRDTLYPLTVPMAQLARETWRRLAQGLADRKLEFEMGELPACTGDERMLLQLWARLLSNSVKFTRTCPAVRIEVGRDAALGAYFVRDNGVGFDMRHSQRLFGLFERLHGDEQFEGTGVGLAIAERIVRRHGGRIWAQARPDEGATFYFTIP